MQMGPKKSLRKIPSSVVELQKQRDGRFQDDMFWKQNALHDLWDDNHPPKNREEGLHSQPKRRQKQSRKPMASPVGSIPLEVYTSYRPSSEDHQKMLQESLQEEYHSEMKRRKLERELAVGNVELEELDEEELERQLELETQNSTWEPSRGAHQYHIKQKSDIRRRQLHRYKEKLKAEKEKKTKKLIALKQAKDIDNIAQIQKELDAQELRRQQKNQAVAQKPVRFPRLGKFFHNTNPKTLILSDEIPSNMRQLKPVGNLLRERFILFQQKNIIAPLPPNYHLQRRKRTTKSFVRRYQLPSSL